MKVRFFAFLRDITNCCEAELPYKETVGELVRSLCDIYGEKLKQKIFPMSSQPTGSEAESQTGLEIILLVNGCHIKRLGGLAAPLKPDDEIDIFPIVAEG